MPGTWYSCLPWSSALSFNVTPQRGLGDPPISCSSPPAFLAPLGTYHRFNDFIKSFDHSCALSLAPGRQGLRLSGLLVYILKEGLGGPKERRRPQGQPETFYWCIRKHCLTRRSQKRLPRELAAKNTFKKLRLATMFPAFLPSPLTLRPALVH